MRMYNPEWEAIKDFDYTPVVKDLQFEIAGQEIAADHAERLCEEIQRHLPWMRDLDTAGIHPIHGQPTGRNDNLLINRRVKLVLRLPIDHIEAARALRGKEIDLGAGPVKVGDLKELQLTPYATLYSHFVVTKSSDEVDWQRDLQAELDSLGVRAGLIPGKRRTMRVSGREIGGYSLLLHDVDLLQSMRIQEKGLGLHRQHGCGIFIPHKSIKEVVTL